MTDREYRIRLAWLEMQWNRPTRSDNYLMQICQEIRRVLSKKPNGIKLAHFKLTFGTGTAVERKSYPQTKEEKDKATAMSQASWFGAVFGNWNRRNKTKVNPANPATSKPSQ